MDNLTYEIDKHKGNVQSVQHLTPEYERYIKLVAKVIGLLELYWQLFQSQEYMILCKLMRDENN